MFLIFKQDTENTAAPSDCVFLIHGLARTAKSMRPLERFLQYQGLPTFNFDYPSRHHRIETLAEQFLSADILKCQTQFQPRQIHFVTHSMGGLVLRQYLKQHTLANLGRVVMLAPPNQGSQIVDALASWKLFRWLNGPAGEQLGTSPSALPLSLGPAGFEVGIIAGSKSWNLFLSRLLPGANDGKVCVENTKLTNMRDFLVLPYTHTFLMRQKNVWEATWQFLQTGQFGATTVPFATKS